MTSPLDELTGNITRSQAILLIVREAMDEGNATLEHATPKGERFGKSFDPLSQEEFDAAHSMLQQPDPPAVESIADAPPEVTVTDGNVPLSALTREEAHAELKALQEALFQARKDRMAAEDAQRRARADMAAAIAEWSAGGPAYTQEMLARDTIRANQQHKLDVAEGRVAPITRTPRALRSRIDLEAHFRSGGDAATYARKQLQRGSRRFGRGDVMTGDGRIVRVPSER